MRRELDFHGISFGYFVSPKFVVLENQNFHQFFDDPLLQRQQNLC